MEHAELLDAIAARHAVRRYTDTPIPADVRTALDTEIARCNQASGLRMRALYDEPEGFRGGMSHYGSLQGVRNYLALVGDPGPGRDEACGYWGQHIVLLAQHLGLNSCWVGLTFNKRKVRAAVDAKQELSLVVALGYGESPGHPHKARPVDEYGSVRTPPMPDWFRRGLEAVALAPSGLNQQKYHFELDGDVVRTTAGTGAYTQTDLGIAKYHFEIGANNPDWRWG